MVKYGDLIIAKGKLIEQLDSGNKTQIQSHYFH